MAEYYRMYPARWNEGTDGLSLEEEAAYLRIMNASHIYDQPIVADMRVLNGLWRCGTMRSKRILQALVDKGKLHILNGRLHNNRLTYELEHRQRLRTIRQQVANKSATSGELLPFKPLEKLNGHQANAHILEERRLNNKNKTPLLPTDGCEEAVDLWNAMAGRNGLNVVLKLNGTRRAKLVNSLTEVNGVDGWRRALDKVERSAFLKGGSDKQWKVTFDWLVETVNITKVLEGNYDDRRGDPLKGLTSEEREIFLRHSTHGQS